MSNATIHQKQIFSGRLTRTMNFHEKVWAVCARIPEGKVVTYGDIARTIGGESFRGYRAVGHALNRNPLAPRVPCHRVVGSTGALTGFAGGLAQKRKMLEDEGVAVENGRVDLNRFRARL